MNSEIAKFVVHQVADRIGVAISAKLSRNGDGQTCECVPLDGHPNESFAIHLNLKWRSAEAVLVPGRFSASLIQQMGKATDEGRQVFMSLAKALESKRIKVRMRVNGSEVNPVAPTEWPAEWTHLELTLRTPPLVIEDEDVALQERLILELVVPFFGMMAALIGVEENDPETRAEIEGAAVQTHGIRYERKKINREACIQLKGWRCVACGFDFAETYGSIGIAYIEVHHIKPLATIEPGYRFDIESDLVPLCSNCHAMAHREEPPVSPDRLKSMVDERRKASSTIK